MGKRKFIVDCDVGTDDAMAIMMLLSQSQQPDVDLLAITAVYGNAPVDNTAFNCLRVLKACDRLGDIPVYKGCTKPMLGGSCPGDGFHGNDGMGDITEEDQPSKDMLQKDHAVQALIRLVTENTGEVTLVALGPLTNLAMALHLDPEFGHKLKDCVVMGGNTQGRGNIAVCSEFNFYSDPEAANFVLNNMGRIITIAPLETCDEWTFDWEWYDKYVSLPTNKAQFVKVIDKAAVCSMKRYKAPKYWAWDQLAMATAIDNSVAMETTDAYVTVELHGGLTRAQMVVDWYNKLKKPVNARLVMKVDMALYKKYMYQAVDWTGQDL